MSVRCPFCVGFFECLLAIFFDVNPDYFLLCYVFVKICFVFANEFGQIDLSLQREWGDWAVA